VPVILNDFASLSKHFTGVHIEFLNEEYYAIQSGAVHAVLYYAADPAKELHKDAGSLTRDVYNVFNDTLENMPMYLAHDKIAIREVAKWRMNGGKREKYQES
jgi:hypothetical protein